MTPARSKEELFNFPSSVLAQLAEMEHERWVKAKLEAGWRWAPETEKDRKLHKDLLPWHELSDEQRARLYTAEEATALGAGELPDEEKEKDWDLVKGAADKIGEGIHVRAPVEMARFMKRVETKAAQIS